MTRPAIVPTKSTTRTRAIFETKANEPSPAKDSPTKLATQPIRDPSANMLTIVTVGELLDDLQLTRIANGNRIAALERELGGRFPHLDELQKQLGVLEHDAELELKRAWRKHELAPWAVEFHGVGEKSIARLVAIIGDPGDRPNVAKLWAYCGHGDAARSAKRKGMTQEDLFAQGNPRAKKQVWLIATSLLKAGTREVYDARRLATAERVHAALCVRCGPAGHPAQSGSPWSDGHKHADALRVLGKWFLKELWLAARGQDRCAAQLPAAPPPATVVTTPKTDPRAVGDLRASEPKAQRATKGQSE